MQSTLFTELTSTEEANLSGGLTIAPVVVKKTIVPTVTVPTTTTTIQTADGGAITISGTPNISAGTSGSITIASQGGTNSSTPTILTTTTTTTP